MPTFMCENNYNSPFLSSLEREMDVHLLNETAGSELVEGRLSIFLPFSRFSSAKCLDDVRTEFEIIRLRKKNFFAPLPEFLIDTTGSSVLQSSNIIRFLWGCRCFWLLLSQPKKFSSKIEEWPADIFELRLRIIVLLDTQIDLKFTWHNETDKINRI